MRSHRLVAAATDEGAACLIGNNAPDSQGRRLFVGSDIAFSRRLMVEWMERAKGNRKRVKEFVAQVDEWRKTPPAAADRFKILSEQGWVATPSNGLFMGDLYRVGAEMLMEIRTRNGEEAFQKVIADSRLLLPEWRSSN